MLRDRRKTIERIMMLIEKFREKNATSPERALTIDELGLPPWFKQAMNRRLGQLKIFIEVNGKYYLDENRLKQLQEQYLKTGYRGKRRSWLQYTWILFTMPLSLIISIIIFYTLTYSGIRLPLGEYLIILTIIMMIIAMIRLFLRRLMRRYRPWPPPI
ncbi:MAG: hypothetical protein QW743_01000 [Candidatus Methanomethylicia archaeon]